MDEETRQVIRRVDGEKRRLHRLRVFLSLPSLISQIWRRVNVGPFLTRVQFDAVSYPQYAYGIYSAALQAKALGAPGITVCELGVGYGNGLRAMERSALAISAAIDLPIDVAGFDIGSGLPATTDYRDAIFWYTPGRFAFDVEATRRTLKTSSLHIGPVKDTIPAFLHGEMRYPLGFVSFDLDYYSSTCDALVILQAKQEKRLPRIICYFDDLWGGVSDMTIFSERIGQLESVREFTAKLSNATLEPIPGLRHKRIIPAAWNEQIYAYHDFAHYQYTQRINPT